MNLIRYGWLVNDVVSIVKQWCPVCCKQRTHEGFKGWLICLGEGCGYQTEPEHPAIANKEDVNGN